MCAAHTLERIAVMLNHFCICVAGLVQIAGLFLVCAFEICAFEIRSRRHKPAVTPFFVIQAIDVHANSWPQLLAA